MDRKQAATISDALLEPGYQAVEESAAQRQAAGNNRQLMSRRLACAFILALVMGAIVFVSTGPSVPASALGASLGWLGGFAGSYFFIGRKAP